MYSLNFSVSHCRFIMFKSQYVVTHTVLIQCYVFVLLCVKTILKVNQYVMSVPLFLGSSAVAWRLGRLHLLCCLRAKRCVGQQGTETGRTLCPPSIPSCLYSAWGKARVLLTPCWLIGEPLPTVIRGLPTWKMGCAARWTTTRAQLESRLPAFVIRSHTGRAKRSLPHQVRQGHFYWPQRRRKMTQWGKRNPKPLTSKGQIARGLSAGTDKTQGRRM